MKESMSFPETKDLGRVFQAEKWEEHFKQREYAKSLRCREPGEFLRVLGLNLGCELSGREMKLEAREMRLEGSIGS